MNRTPDLPTWNQMVGRIVSAWTGCPGGHYTSYHFLLGRVRSVYFSIANGVYIIQVFDSENYIQCIQFTSQYKHFFEDFDSDKKCKRMFVNLDETSPETKSKDNSIFEA